MADGVERVLAVVALAVLALVVPSRGVAQRPGVVDSLLPRVVPLADSFSLKQGNPPVFKAYRTDSAGGAATLVGYAFETSDIPPEVYGYSGPIQVLVGMDPVGTISGVRVLLYREPIRADLGDFLRASGVQEQYRGKHISEPFRVYGDLDGIARATISVAAMSLGIRNAARRVAMAYAPPALLGASRPGVATPATIRHLLDDLTWPELVALGLARRMDVSGRGFLGFELFLAYVGSDELGSLVLGPETYGVMGRVVGGVRGTRHPFVVGLYGSSVNSFDPAALSFQQGSRTFSLAREDYTALGAPTQGKVAQQAFYIGVVLVDGALDLAEPFTVRYDTRAPLGVVATTYAVPSDIAVLTPEIHGPGFASAMPLPALPESSAAPAAPAAPSGGAAVVAGPEPASRAPPPSSRPAARGAPAPPPPAAPRNGPAETIGGAAAGAGEIPGIRGWSVVEEGTVLSRLVGNIRWRRVVPLVALLALAMYAFLSKSNAARWAALAGTLVYLGFLDGGFLSVTHITSAITVGPSVYLRDFPLLLLVVFAVATTLLWGRVLCGFLCPFGALQDFLERAVPRRPRRKVSPRVHQYARYVKYGILSLIVVLAVVSPETGIYQYFEPFGTVFFLSPSVVLWGIALGALAGSAVVPRFYCRYVCPLGAALGLGALLAVFRIKRVEPCAACVICERGCPTRAIRKERIDFPECVRCGSCEVKLQTRAGVCRTLSAEEVG